MAVIFGLLVLGVISQRCKLVGSICGYFISHPFLPSRLQTWALAQSQAQWAGRVSISLYHRVGWSSVGESPKVHISMFFIKV